MNLLIFVTKFMCQSKWDIIRIGWVLSLVVLKITNATDFWNIDIFNIFFSIYATNYYAAMLSSRNLKHNYFMFHSIFGIYFWNLFLYLLSVNHFLSYSL